MNQMVLQVTRMCAQYNILTTTANYFEVCIPWKGTQFNEYVYKKYVEGMYVRIQHGIQSYERYIELVLGYVLGFGYVYVSCLMETMDMENWPLVIRWTSWISRLRESHNHFRGGYGIYLYLIK
jgi:hypothetical protein